MHIIYHIKLNSVDLFVLYIGFKLSLNGSERNLGKSIITVIMKLFIFSFYISAGLLSSIQFFSRWSNTLLDQVYSAISTEYITNI